MELAGFTHEVGKSRSKLGRNIEQIHPKTKKPYRFCDLVSSHTLRKTAVTTMLMNGVPEHVVKQISGHVNDSSSFHRYVGYAQSWLDTGMQTFFDGIRNAGPPTPTAFG
ncbi:MAG: tyrosine-type recombinase/integrase [Bacteroidota bacterium]